MLKHEETSLLLLTRARHLPPTLGTRSRRTPRQCPAPALASLMARAFPHLSRLNEVHNSNVQSFPSVGARNFVTPTPGLKPWSWSKRTRHADQVKSHDGRALAWGTLKDSGGACQKGPKAGLLMRRKGRDAFVARCRRVLRPFGTFAGPVGCTSNVRCVG